MRAIWFDGETPLLRDDLPTPVAAPGEAVVAVRLAGVCKTDLEILKGYMGFVGVLGHEFVGEVVEGPGEWLGKRVVAEINCASPGTRGAPREVRNHDPERTVLGIDGRDGCFAERIAVPVENLLAVPDHVTDEQAVLVEPLAAAFEIAEQVDLSSFASAVVLGDGRLGLLCAMVLAGGIADVTVVGKHPGKLALAARRGIPTVLLDDYAPAKDAPLVVEATGSAAGLDLAMRAVRPRGTIVLKSTIAAESGVNLAPLVIDEVTVVGSRCGPFDVALSALADGSIDPTDLITARYPLSEGQRALGAAEDGRNLKVLVEF